MKDNQYGQLSRGLWMNSAYITRQLDNSLGAIHGIGLSEFMVLQTLAEAPGQKLRRIDLAESIGRTASGITRMLMPLEKIGLIIKEKNARDARVSLVKLSEAGTELLADASTTMNQRSERLYRDLSPQQIDDFLEVLATIQQG